VTRAWAVAGHLFRSRAELRDVENERFVRDSLVRLLPIRCKAYLFPTPPAKKLHSCDRELLLLERTLLIRCDVRDWIVKGCVPVPLEVGK